MSPGHDTRSMVISNLKIKSLKNYSFETLAEIYSKALVSIVPEWRGSFELVPIESLMSGVPTISPEVPSLKIVRSHYELNFTLGARDVVLPYYDYCKVRECMDSYELKHDFIEWLTSADQQREAMSATMKRLFSLETAGRSFFQGIKNFMQELNGKGGSSHS